jgi:hypothetical protein
LIRRAKRGGVAGPAPRGAGGEHAGGLRVKQAKLHRHLPGLAGRDAGGGELGDHAQDHEVHGPAAADQVSVGAEERAGEHVGQAVADDGAGRGRADLEAEHGEARLGSLVRR